MLRFARATIKRLARFRLRTLLALMALASLALAAFVKPTLEARRQLRAIRAIEAAGGEIVYGEGVVRNGVASGLLRSWFGDDAVRPIVLAKLDRPSMDCESVIEALSAVREVKGITLWRTELSKTAAEKLSTVRGLDCLCLDQVTVSTEAFQSLSQCESLRLLTVSGDSIDDETMDCLVEFTALESLLISRSSITRDGLVRMARCRGLRSLTITRQPQLLAGTNAATLLELKQLQWLNLVDVGVDDGTMEVLAKLVDLKHLHIYELQPTVTDAGLRRIGELRNLESLSLSSSGITDQSIESIVQLRRLSSLDISDCYITDEGLAELARCASLTHLDLTGASVTDTGILHLADHPSLESLEIEIGQGVTRQGLRRLLDEQPNLQVSAFVTEPDGTLSWVDIP
ncbi:MAG: hypothetical protein AAGJ46_00540 [Planctomycetota bacterium]